MFIQFPFNFRSTFKWFSDRNTAQMRASKKSARKMIKGGLVNHRPLSIRQARAVKRQA